MELRRAIAAFLTFTFATLLCGPAFAGAWAVASGTSEAGCCCSKKEETRHVTVQEQKCSCPACACTIGDAPPMAPLHALGEASIESFPTLAAAPSLVTATAANVQSREAGIAAARGPPGDAHPPLYILYDTLLI